MTSDTLMPFIAIVLLGLMLMTVRAVYGLFAWKGRRKKALSQVLGFPVLGLVFMMIAGALMPKTEAQIAERLASSAALEIQRAAETEERKKKEANEAARLADIQLARTPPQKQQALLDAISAGRIAYDAAPNEMAQGGTRPQRASAICAAFQSMSASGWIGRVKRLSSTSDGYGVLSVEIGDQVTVSTGNDIIGFMSSNTLIAPTSNVFQAASGMSEGMWVRFAGTFYPDHPDCLQELSATMYGSMMDPEFVFRFSFIEPLSRAEDPAEP